MTYTIVVQNAAKGITIPNPKELKQWAKTALKGKISSAEVTLRIVDKNESRELNHTYRKKNKPTNVLSFPFDMPKDIDMDIPILGDIAICAEIVAKEAAEQNKPEKAHWAHMVIHGILHLLGFDHENDQDADIMEQEETVILNSLGFPDPYKINEKVKHHE